MKTAPIILFVYNRLHCVRQTIESLKRNKLAKQSDLIIYSDGPKSSEDKKSVDLVRSYIRNIEGFRDVSIIERSRNVGLGAAIIRGVTEAVNKFDRVIVLEDDLETSPYFLQYMNDGLDIYEYEDKVISICGYCLPVKKRIPETFFIRDANCLGWATWKRGWDLFEENGQMLLEELKEKGLTRRFDFDGAYRYTLMLRLQIAGINNSWAVRWYASAFLGDKLTLYPGRSLVRHIGNDGSGSNFGTSDVLNVTLTERPIAVGSIEIEETLEVRRLIQEYLRAIKKPVHKAALDYAKRCCADLVKRFGN